MTLEELEIKFTAQTSGLASQLGGIKTQLGGVETGTGKVASAFKGMVKTGMAIGGAMIARELFQIGKESIAMANDAVESDNLFTVAMGDMGGAAKAWSEELQSSLGLNAIEVRKNVGTLNTMFDSMGLGKQQAYDMATSMTKLAYDMSSFYNLPVEEAFEKLSAGITGETEPLKRLGILVDENTVKQYAYANGIAKQGKELTQQQKIQARYGAIMKQTSKAQGDLARTIDSPVNQLRKMNTQFDMAKIALGQSLQPAMLAVIPALTGIAMGATNVINALSGVGSEDGLNNVLITVDKARKMAAEVVGTGFADIAAKIEQASKDTDAAISTFKSSETATKNVLLDISFNPPTVSNYDLVTTKLATLKSDIGELDGAVTKYIDTYLTPLLQSGVITQAEYDKRVAKLQLMLDTLQTNADKLESKVNAKIAAAMEDKEVTPEEKAAILKAIEDEVNRATKDMTATADKMKAQIAADLKAKKITQSEADAAVLLVDAELKTALANLHATADNLKANVGIGDWNVITLSQTQTDDLAAQITATIEASNVVVHATIDEVKAEFTETGAIGLVVGTLYERMGQKITEQNALIAGKIAGWTSGLKPTQEQVAEVMAAVAERDRLLSMLNPETTFEGKSAIAILDLTLDTTSIKNYFKALSDAVDSETISAEENFKKQVARLAVAAGMPEWDSVLATFGLSGKTYEQAVEALRQQMLSALSAKENKAVIDAAAKLLPSILEHVANGDTSAAQAAISDFVSGLDFSGLDDAARQAIFDMLSALDLTGMGLGNLGGLEGSIYDFLGGIDYSGLAGNAKEQYDALVLLLGKIETQKKLIQENIENPFSDPNYNPSAPGADIPAPSGAQQPNFYGGFNSAEIAAELSSALSNADITLNPSKVVINEGLSSTNEGVGGGSLSFGESVSVTTTPITTNVTLKMDAYTLGQAAISAMQKVNVSNGNTKPAGR